VTTLEEVFIKVAHGNDEEIEQKVSKSRSASEGLSLVHGQNEDEIKLDGSEDFSDPRKSKKNKKKEQKAEEEDYDFKAKTIDTSQSLAYFFKHYYALLMKRYGYFMRDTKSWILQFIVPVVFTLGGLIILEFVQTQQDPSLVLDINDYNTRVHSEPNPIPYTNDTQYKAYDWASYGPIYGQEDVMNNFDDASQLPIRAANNVSSTPEFSQYLADLREAETYKASIYGALAFQSINPDWYEYIVHANYTGVHAAPLYTTLGAEAFFRTSDPSLSLTVTLHPMPYTQQEEEIISNFDTTTAVFFILIAIPFIPSAFVVFVVRERETKAKHIQLVSGVSPMAYWLSSWSWDIFSYQFSCWAFVIMIVAFDVTLLVDNGALAATILLFFGFGFASSSFTYLTSFFFKSHSTAQVIVIFMNIVFGFLLSLTGMILRLIDTTTDIYNDTLKYLFLIFPPFALGDGLLSLVLREFFSFIELSGNKIYEPSDWKITGANVIFLFGTGVGYIILTILVEYLMAIPSVHSFFFHDRIPSEKHEEDEDVLEEANRVLNDQASDDLIVIKDIKKVYGDGKFAVRGISLGIPAGECFGLLGINGAGKTTTLSMLSGEFPPSSGEAFMAGYPILTNIHEARREMGYCPQFDALFDLLTGREHLNLYARIKGVREEEIDRVVNKAW
jgi:ABC-type multidrug transport system fused ATPase/permease subunit